MLQLANIVRVELGDSGVESLPRRNVWPFATLR